MIPAVAALNSDTEGRILRNNAPSRKSESVHNFSGVWLTYECEFGSQLVWQWLEVVQQSYDVPVMNKLRERLPSG